MLGSTLPLNDFQTIPSRLPLRATFLKPTRVPRKPEHLSLRMSEEGKTLLHAFQDFYGLSQSGVFEFILREWQRHILNTQGVDVVKLASKKR